jgi:hypothetical protein
MRICRLVFCAVLFLAAGPLAALDCARAANAADQPRPAQRPRVPLELLWPAGLGAGYISITLKQHLRRRGASDPAGRPAYSDLLSLNRHGGSPAEPDTPAGPAAPGCERGRTAP